MASSGHDEVIARIARAIDSDEALADFTPASVDEAATALLAALERPALPSCEAALDVLCELLNGGSAEDYIYGDRRTVSWIRRVLAHADRGLPERLSELLDAASAPVRAGAADCLCAYADWKLNPEASAPETRLADEAIAAAWRKVAALTSDPDPEVRAAATRLQFYSRDPR